MTELRRRLTAWVNTLSETTWSAPHHLLTLLLTETQADEDRLWAALRRAYDDPDEMSPHLDDVPANANCPCARCEVTAVLRNAPEPWRVP